MSENDVKIEKQIHVNLAFCVCAVCRQATLSLDIARTQIQ